MRRKLVAGLALASVWTVLRLFGAAVTADEALLAVENWIAEGDAFGCGLGTVAGEAVEYSGADGTGAFYVVPLEKADGTRGGFVITSAETRIAPVIAFSDEGEFVASDENPLWALLSLDIAKETDALAANETNLKLLTKTSGGPSDDAASRNETKWSRLLTKRTAKALFMAATPSDLRVDALLTTAWSQEGVSGGYCYNYYTPNHYPCGCVATAFAQLLYCWKWPTDSITTRWDYSGDNGSGGTWTLAKGSTLGPWAWSSMADNPSSDTQRKAVGQLCWDCGRLVNMAYSSVGSGASVANVRRRLLEEIAYASSQFYAKTSGIDTEVLKKAVIPSLEAGCPVLMGIFTSDMANGHAILGDGYGYSGGSFYMHLNLGWGNNSSYNTWYQPPTIQGYTMITDLVYNIYPTGTDFATIVSGRVFNSSGSAMSGQTVVATRTSDNATFTVTTNSKGSYALKLPRDNTYVITAESNGAVGTATKTLGTCISADVVGGGYYLSGEYGATAQGVANSVANEYDVDLTINSLYPPTCSSASGTTFWSDTASVTLSCASSGATIRYTTDGSEPTEASAAYSGAISLAVGTTTIKAKAFKSGCNPSETMTATFTFPPKVETPALSPASAVTGSTFVSRYLTFTLGCGTSGATIRYTLDGSDPTEDSPIYTGAVEVEGVVGEARTIKVRAFLDGYRPSAVYSVSYTRTASSHWIEESVAAHEATGWWNEKMELADGSVVLSGDKVYTANSESAATAKTVTIDAAMTFGFAESGEGEGAPPQARVGLRIGPNGCFQALTRTGGVREWVDLSGLSATAGVAHDVHLVLDLVGGTYTAQVDSVPLRRKGGSKRLPFAADGADGIRRLGFVGLGALESLVGEQGDEYSGETGFKIIFK